MDGYRDSVYGPLQDDGLMDTLEELAAPVPDNLGRIPTRLDIVRIDIGRGATYRAADGRWNRLNRVAGLEALPANLGPTREQIPDRFWDLWKFQPIPALVFLGQKEGACEIWRTLPGPRVRARRDLLWLFCDHHFETEVTVFPATLTVEHTVATDLPVLANQLNPTYREKVPPRRVSYKTDDGKPVVGFRTWLLHLPSQVINHEIVELEPRLFGPQMPPNQAGVYEWKDAEKSAICGVEDHHAPDPGRCDCGVYARHDFAGTKVEFGYGYGYRPEEAGVLVRGAVLGSGDVFIYDEGWRAEMARVIGFDSESVRPEYLPALQRLASRFDVPILPRQQLEELALRKGRVLRKRDLEGV
jgi:hypothetical protein